MKLHANAALSLKQRERMVVRVLEDGWSLDEFPVKSTEQGGEFGELRTDQQPSLKAIDHSANRAPGQGLATVGIAHAPA